MKNATQAMVSALLVITRDPKISMWLKDNDPKALMQAKDALLLAYDQTHKVMEAFHGRAKTDNPCTKMMEAITYCEENHEQDCECWLD